MRQRPDPARLWVAVAPRLWPGPDHEWIDLATGGLGRHSPAVKPMAPAGEMLDDVVYLPLVAPEFDDQRRAVAHACLESGAPVLLQLRPGESADIPEARPFYDLTDFLLAGDLEALAKLPPDAVAVWPLLAGLTDGEELQREGLDRLAAVGVACVRGLTPVLAPGDRRRLAALGDDDTYHRLFHGEPPSERQFARAAFERGLKPFVDRPLPAARRLSANRRLGGLMALIGELWLRSERTEGRGQAFYRAARWIDRSEHDLTALVREGNLPVVSWLDGESRRVIEEYVRSGRSELLTELEAEYLAGADS